MEALLNLAWVLMTAAMVLLWIRFGTRKGPSRNAQLLALVVLLLVLFPVISVSDDLLALQNPAEADCCLKRDHVVASAHSVMPAVTDLPRPPVADVPLRVQQRSADGERIPLAEAQPGLAAIDNRPPPSA